MRSTTFSGIGFHAAMICTVLPAFCLCGLAGTARLSTASGSKPKT